jgi:adenylosuccinate synthase
MAMLVESQHLATLGISDAFARTTIDERALLITPFARAVNRLRELARGDARHGSCGIGIGETMADALTYGEQVPRIGDLRDPPLLREKLRFVHQLSLRKAEDLIASLPHNERAETCWHPLRDPHPIAQLLDSYITFAAHARITGPGYVKALFRRPGTIIFEGAQGVLLDEWHGFHPHTTWSTTTLANAQALLRAGNFHGKVTRIGITRAYATRHGTGPLPTEDTALSVALPDQCNRDHPWAQRFRVGWLDLVLLRYALAVVGPLDTLALTCLDRIADLAAFHICTRYRCDGAQISCLPPSPQPQNLAYQEQLARLLSRCQPELTRVAQNTLPDVLAAELEIPLGIRSYGPTAADKIDTVTR